MALPKTIYVRKEKDGDETYLVAGESVDEAVPEDGVTVIGTYKLESSGQWERVAKLVERNGKRRG